MLPFCRVCLVDYRLLTQRVWHLRNSSGAEGKLANVSELACSIVCPDRVKHVHNSQWTFSRKPMVDPLEFFSMEGNGRGARCPTVFTQPGCIK